MKKSFSVPVLMFSFGVLALVLSFASFSLANQGADNEVIGGNNAVIIANIPENTPNPTCVDNWKDWQSSQNFTSGGQWSLALFPAYLGIAPFNDFMPKPEVIRQFIDINGDGLQDYVFLDKGADIIRSINLMEGCVLINNGTNWTVAYKCVIARDPQRNNEVYYYGDCAAE